jgi:hypothetical protein
MSDIENFYAKLTVIVLVIITALFISFLVSWPVMVLWNGCLVGAVDTVNEVSWLQAWGLSALFNLLFKSTYIGKKND